MYNSSYAKQDAPLIARFMGPTWGPSGADRTQVGPLLAPWTIWDLLRGLMHDLVLSESLIKQYFLILYFLSLYYWTLKRRLHHRNVTIYRPHVLSYQICLDTKPVLYQDRFCIFYRGYKTGFVPKRVKTCILSNTKIEASIRATKPKPRQSHLTSDTVEIFIQYEKAGLVSTQSRFWCGRFRVGAKPVLVRLV